MQALGSGRREGALAKAALDRGAVAWSTVTALLILVANLMQHVLHPPLSECEDAIREAGGAWDPTAPFVFSETWSPEHELRVQWKVGKWAYLTSQVLALQAIYHVASLACELRGRPRGEALTRVVYGGAAVIGGFGALVFVLYAFFWVLQHSHPEWRAQWNFFEDRGYARFEPMMHAMHTPAILCPMIDILLVKDARLLREHTWSTRALCAATLCVTAYYNLFSALNARANGGAFAYPWYMELTTPLLWALYLAMIYAIELAFVFPFRSLIQRCSERTEALATSRKSE